MAKSKSNTDQLEEFLLSDHAKLEQKAKLIHQMVVHDEEAGSELVKRLLKPAYEAKELDRIALLVRVAMDTSEDNGFELVRLLLKLNHASRANEKAIKKTREYQAVFEEMEQSPKRIAVFLGLVDADKPVPHAMIKMPDGTPLSVPVPDEKLARTLKRGDEVEVDQQLRAVVAVQPIGASHTGEIGILERLDGDHVDITLRDQDPQRFLASQELVDRLASEEVQPGAKVVVNSRQAMAFCAIDANGRQFEHYRYLSDEPLPRVRLTDLGAPPAYVQEVLDEIRFNLEDEHEALRERWPTALLRALCLQGPSGAGKSYSLLALIREAYELMASIVGIPVEEMPSRLFRLSAPGVLSPWLGQSDKNIDRLFSEARQLAGEPIEFNGQTYHLPVIVVLEEIDALARRRSTGGLDHEDVYSRLCNAILVNTDCTREDMANKHLIVIATTNLSQALDQAFTRRFGSVPFGYLKRRDFRSVLSRQLDRYPVAVNGDPDEALARRRIVDQAEAFLFAPHTDKGQLKVFKVGSSQPETIYRRQLVTPAIVAKAVEQAARWTRRYEGVTGSEIGISSKVLLDALNHQIRDIASICNRFNIEGYVDVGPGQISDVALVEQPLLATNDELLRAAS